MPRTRRRSSRWTRSVLHILLYHLRDVLRDRMEGKCLRDHSFYSLMTKSRIEERVYQQFAIAITNRLFVVIILPFGNRRSSIDHRIKYRFLLKFRSCAFAAKGDLLLGFANSPAMFLPVVISVFFLGDKLRHLIGC